MDYIFHNGNIITLNNQRPPEAVLVRDNIIFALGSFNLIKNIAINPEILNLQGDTLMPAMTDAHTHFVETAKLQSILDVSGCKNDDDFYNKLIEYRKTQDILKIKWISGFGWEKRYIEKYPNINISLIDKIFPDIPVSIASKDLHSNLCNTKAIERIKKHPDYKSIMLSNGFLGEGWWTVLNKVIPELDDDILKKQVKDLIKKCQKMGLSGVHSMENKQAAEIVSKVALSEDFYFTWYYSELGAGSSIPHSSLPAPHFHPGGIKIFTDGSLGSDTAWMFEFDTPIDNIFLQNLKQQVLNANNHKIQAAIHAIGDKAVFHVTSILKEVYKEAKYKIKNRIEHLQAVRPVDIPLLKEAHIHASMQPVHKKNDDEIINQKWKIAKDYAFPVSQVHENCVLAFGSDSPVETLNPFEGIKIANKSLPLVEVLKAYTCNHHLIANKKISYGLIKKNQIANLIVVDLKKEFIEETELTMIDGKIVFSTTE